MPPKRRRPALETDDVELTRRRAQAAERRRRFIARRRRTRLPQPIQVESIMEQRMDQPQQTTPRARTCSGNHHQSKLISFLLTLIPTFLIHDISIPHLLPQSVSQGAVNHTDRSCVVSLEYLI